MALWLLVISSLLGFACAAPTTTVTVTATPPAISTTLIQTAIPTTVQITIASGRASIVSNVVELASSSYVLTYTPSPTASAAAATETPSIHLDTKINAAWGVAGALLVLTGLPMAFWGHKNRWSSYFLIGFYTLSLVCLVLILKFGVLQEVNPPSIKLEGLFFLACVVAGVAGGGIAIFFWKGARYFVGAWGGFAFALYVQCMHSGGVIKPTGFKWLFYIAVSAVGFIACTIQNLHYPVLLVSTAFVGSTAVILGVDCFSTAGLKEFYISNIGFGSLFVPLTSHNMPYPVSQTMMIELGLIAAVALMGIAVQLRFYRVLKRKMREIEEAERIREMETDERAGERVRAVRGELDQWEKEHGDGTATESVGTPGAKDLESGEMLPTLDLGTTGDAEDLSGGMVKTRTAVDQRPSIFTPPGTNQEDQGLKEKLAMLEEIRKVRQNIETLRSSTSLDYDRSEGSTLFTPASNQPIPRPQRADRPRPGAIDVSRLSRTLKLPGNPETTDWDEYTTDRKLLTPPIGPSGPIPTSPIAMSPAVKEALEKRMDLENAMALAEEGSLDRRGRRASKSSGLLTLDMDRRSASRLSRLSGFVTTDSERRRSGEVSPRERKGSIGRLSALTLDGEGPGGRRASIGSVLDQLHSTPSPIGDDNDAASASPEPTSPPPKIESPSRLEFKEPRKERRTNSMLPFPGAQQKVATMFSSSSKQPHHHSRSMSMGETVVTSASGVVDRHQPTTTKGNRRSILNVSPTVAVVPRRRPVSPPPQASPFTTAQTPGELAAISSRHREKMRAMQAPLTREEQERKKLGDAKDRWEKSKAVERQVMERKEREYNRQSQLPSPDSDNDERSRPNPAAEKVFQWQKRSSTMRNLEAEGKQKRQSKTPQARFSGEDFNPQQPQSAAAGLRQASPVDEGYGSGTGGQRPGPSTNLTPPHLAPPISKRSSTSRSLDAWNMFSSPGMARPPSPDLPHPGRPMSPN